MNDNLINVQSEPPALTIERMALGDMANFIYLLVPTQRGRLAVVDPAWEPERILARAAELDRVVTDIVLTHHHPDHRNGVEALLERYPARIHVQKAEQPWLKGLGWLADCVLHQPGDTLDLGGGAQVQMLHTPGHTPGSQCLLCRDAQRGDKLLTGDTLFVDGCGRCDLPGGDAQALFASLHHTLAKLDPQTRVLPGHDYGPTPEATLADQRQSNPYLKLDTVGDFVAYRMKPRG